MKLSTDNKNILIFLVLLQRNRVSYINCTHRSEALDEDWVTLATLSFLLPKCFHNNKEWYLGCCFPKVLSSVQFSCLVMSNCLWSHGLQHPRSPCPSTTPGVYLNSCPLSRWCHPTISSSVFPFSSHLQPFSASGSFPMSQLFSSGGLSIETSLNSH